MRLRAGYGPTLPAVARSRLGLPSWATAAILVAIVAAGLLAVLMRGGTEGGRTQLSHRGTPAFNVLYEESAVRPATPRSGELVRLEARRRAVGARLTVSALPDSELPFGALPVYAEAHIAALREELGELEVPEEGKARIWGHPGYRIDYAAGRTTGRDVLLFPDETALRGGALVSFRQERSGRRVRARERAAVEEVRRVQRSFQFGADRR